MRIKDANGMELNVGSQAQSTLNTVLGAIGTANALGNGLNLFGMGGRGPRQPQDEGDRPVTRYEMGLIRESLAKDNEITLLKAQQYTDRAIEGVNIAIGKQTTWNAVQANNIAMLEKQLGDITKFVVPITSIDPVPTSSETTNTATQNNSNGQ